MPRLLLVLAGLVLTGAALWFLPLGLLLLALVAVTAAWSLHDVRGRRARARR